MAVATKTRGQKTQVARAVDAAVSKAKLSSKGSESFKLGEKMGELGSRLSAVNTEPVHKAYSKSSEKTRAKMLADFMIGYVMKYLPRCSQEIAETIVGMSRAKRKEKNETWELAANAAAKAFRYHVVRTGRTNTSAAGGGKKVRVDTNFKTEAIKFVETIWEEANSVTLRQAAKLLMAMAKRMKA